MSSDSEVDTAFQRMIQSDEELVEVIDEQGNKGYEIRKKKQVTTTDDKGIVEKVQFTLDKKSLDKSLMSELDNTRKQLEQSRRDMESLRDEKRGGGQVQLRVPKNQSFETVAEMIDDLYLRESKGDPKATKQMKKLWERVVDELSTKEGKSHVLMACPSCGRGIDRNMLKDNKCPFCEFDFLSYKRGGGEVW